MDQGFLISHLKKMTQNLFEFLLESQSIQYAVFDENRLLESTSSDFSRHFFRKVKSGETINTVFPELLGMEQVLDDGINRGERVEIDNIISFDQSGKEQYLSLQVLPFRKKILIVARDTTDSATIEQRLMQQRNELSLLTNELEKTQARLVDITGRFVPGQVFDSLLADKNAPRVNGVLRDVSIVFADIRGFTKWSQDRAPEDTFDLVNSFLTQVIDIVSSYNGTLDKFMGDGFMAIFNAPHTQADHIQRAVKCAEKISKIEKQGLYFGVGVHSGQAMAGNIGNAQIMNYTVLGAAVNTAKRLEEAAKAGEVLLSESTVQALDYFAQTEYISDLHIHKHLAPVPIYRLKS